jgi:hypothetical protein
VKDRADGTVMMPLRGMNVRRMKTWALGGGGGPMRMTMRRRRGRMAAEGCVFKKLKSAVKNGSFG